MTIVYKTGSIFDSTARYLVNPVNCVGVSGAGLAKQFKEKFPKPTRYYEQLCKFEKMLASPGGCVVYDKYFENPGIIYAFTKQHYKDKSTLEIVESCLKRIAVRTSNCAYDMATVAIPKLGCGCGGLKWEDVKPLYEKHLANTKIVFEVYE